MISGQSKYAGERTLRSTAEVAFLLIGKSKKRNKISHILLILQFKERRDLWCSGGLLPTTQQFHLRYCWMTKDWQSFNAYTLKKSVRMYCCQNKACEQNIKEGEERNIINHINTSKIVLTFPWAPLNTSVQPHLLFWTPVSYSSPIES